MRLSYLYNKTSWAGKMASLYWHSPQVLGKGLLDIDGLVQDCSISIANAMEILQYYTKHTP